MTHENNRSKGCGCGIGTFGIGSVIAMIISFTSWHSIPWMLFHGFLGWIYIIYYILTYGF
ncbi:MAG: hypothetical protein FWG14_00050 [Peptococcaceae bacterium]|nr:hypothetical protein [Peptococcaceae bacterium]